MMSPNLDPQTWTRSYSATAYYLPYKDRKNLTVSKAIVPIVEIDSPMILVQVLTGALVSRILFADAHTNDNLTASGVEFIYDEKTYVTHSNKEVILSAGYVPCVSQDRT
jgi:hypothetical protein